MNNVTGIEKNYCSDVVSVNRQTQPSRLRSDLKIVLVLIAFILKKAEYF